jgi:hypothetical protein
MPRRLSYTPDDEDDDLRRRANSSGGGLPAWVWVLGSGGLLAVVVVVGLGFALFTARRSEARHEAARAEVMRVEAQFAPQAAPLLAEGTRRVPAPGDPAGEAEEVALAEIAKAYRADPEEANAKYTGRRLRVAVEVRRVGDGWVGAVASIGRLQRDRSPNVFFHIPGPLPAAGASVVIEGTCDGFSDEPQTGVRLTFRDCRVVEE